MTRETMAERQVRLEEQMRALSGGVAALVEQGKEAAESRRRVYQTQEDMRLELADLKNRMNNLERGVEAIRPTTAELERVRDRVVFAGSLGKGLWELGKVMLSVAAGFASAWYALTGRPPP